MNSFNAARSPWKAMRTYDMAIVMPKYKRTQEQGDTRTQSQGQQTKNAPP